MASTIKVNNIQNQCGANIVNKCSTTITLGASGDNITLACGATQSGFGRTGTVNWDTTAKTAGFTAVSGNGYFVNTTSGAITVTLPATPSAGDIVAIADYANTWQTNNVTVARNGSLINGNSFDYIGDTEGISLTFVYVDGTRGWKNVNDGTTNASGTNPYVLATGGTILTCGDYKTHIFTGPGTFTVTCAGTPSGSTTVDYLVVAGGGSGGNVYGAGGGAGGYRESSGTASGCYTASPLGACVSALPVTAQGYPITVGGGGAGAVPTVGNTGSNSVFSTITSTGGGGGGGNNGACAGLPGGSGGGATGGGPGGQSSAGSGNTPPVSPPQGNNGGAASGPSTTGYSGGGGGAAAAATNQCGADGVGTAITTSTCYGTPGPTPGVRYYAGGGGGRGSPPTADGEGGVGGGGSPSLPPSGGESLPGTVNTGGGGMGAIGPIGSGAGGSGIVIIRYKYQ